MSIRDTLIDQTGDEDLLFMDGYDAAICGVVSRISQEDIVCYDYEMVILQSVANGMSREEAEEFFAFNQIGAYVGERTPCFLRRFP